MFVIYFVLFTSCFLSNSLTDANFNEVANYVTSKNVCQTRECIFSAASILQNMDETVQPCDDFYQFTCGNFIKNTAMDEYQVKVTMLSKLDDELLQKLKTTIESESEETNHQRTFKLVRSYYQACMNQDAIDESETDLKEVLKQIGGWPVVVGKDWDERNWDWKETIYKFKKIGFATDDLVNLDIDVDSKNNSRYVLSLDKADTDLSQKYLLNGWEDKVVQAYFKLMTDIAEYFGAEKIQAQKEMTDVLNLQMALAKISLPIEERRNFTLLYNPMTVKQLTERFSYIPWRNYINSILRPDASVNNDDEIIVGDVGFFDKLGNILVTTPKRTLANYLAWRVIGDSIGQMNENLRDLHREYLKVLQGSGAKIPKWQECVSQLKKSLQVGTSALYVREHFDKSARDKALNIIRDLKASFQEMLNELTWMDDQTKKRASEKLQYIFPHIAYPDEFFDDAKLDEFHENLEIVDDNYFKNTLNIRRFLMKYDAQHLRKPVNKTDWVTHGYAAIVNAFYDPSENSIQFPAGILQGIFFSNNRPNYLNYGAIGYVMGHEITHGFDDQGSQFDKNGNLLNWWEQETADTYSRRTRCIVDQYSNQTVKDINLNINGFNTQGENIADNGGVKEAYLAYNRFEKEHGVEPALPGLPFTSQQMFWIAIGNVWCTKIRPEYLRKNVITDEHSPGEFRVNIPLSNSPQFAKDFNCALGTPMNPENKCAVW